MAFNSININTTYIYDFRGPKSYRTEKQTLVILRSLYTCCKFGKCELP